MTFGTIRDRYHYYYYLSVERGEEMRKWKPRVSLTAELRLELRRLVYKSFYLNIEHTQKSADTHAQLHKLNTPMSPAPRSRNTT